MGSSRRGPGASAERERDPRRRHEGKGCCTSMSDPKGPQQVSTRSTLAKPSTADSHLPARSSSPWSRRFSSSHNFTCSHLPRPSSARRLSTLCKASKGADDGRRRRSGTLGRPRCAHLATPGRGLGADLELKKGKEIDGAAEFKRCMSVIPMGMVDKRADSNGSVSAYRPEVLSC